MDLKSYLKVIEKFISDYLVQTKMAGYVLGLSGGVDSSLVAALTKASVGKDKLKVVLIPIESNPDDLKDGQEIVKLFDLNAITIDGTSIYLSAVEELKNKGVVLDTLTSSNLKVRIRMCILYAYAQMNRSLVIGTDNMDERYTGYFTKYGDGGVDLLPIARLTKGEVIEAAKIYGLPARLAERIPTAGLFEGQTDEKEMGLLYKDLDDYLLGKPVDSNVSKRAKYLHDISEHKRSPIPMPEEFIRD